MSAQEIEARARMMGWSPDGPLDAEAYIKRGEEIEPILKANNRKLTDKVAQQESEIASTKKLLTEATAAIEELKFFNSELTKKAVKEQKKEVLAAIAAAKEGGDVATEVQLTDQLTEINASLKEAEKAPAKKEEQKKADTPQLSEEAKAWMAANPWFGQDRRKTGFAYGLSDEWKAQGKQAGTKEFFEHVDAEMAKVFDPNAERRERSSKVEGTNNSSGGGSKGKTYADLPQEAKDACERFAERLVKKGGKFETKEAYRKSYIANYDWS